MRKTPTLYIRDQANPKCVTDVVNPNCQWVIDGEGTPTRKFDGTCTMLGESGWWARREVKSGKKTPKNFKPVSTDKNTGKTVGWEPIEQSSFAKFHVEALTHIPHKKMGTYELCGPKINGNPENLEHHVLIPHGTFQFLITDIMDLMKLCKQEGWEGVVWHHPDGRKAKLKTRDFAVIPLDFGFRD